MKYNLPELPKPAKKEPWQTSDNGKWVSGVTNYWSEDQMRQYAEQAVSPLLAEIERMKADLEAREMVIGEAYQVVGSMLSDLGVFDSDIAGRVLDNLSEMRQVHNDVLPWPSFEQK